ncbi:MAG TPA: hypothetical protein VGP94_11075 [Tepidisphaeraceae bacterium]|nr:hypothetical protein [Tepidisphaeraceae bacterium]
MVKSDSTGLIAILVAVFVTSLSSPTIHAQTTTGTAERVAPLPRPGAEIDAVTWRAVIATWKNVQQTIEKGKPVTRSVPVYVVSRFQEDPLSEDQQREIFEKARKADLWRDIWFITVSSNFDGRYTARVYFMPDIVKGRVRQGKVLACANWIKMEVTAGRWPPLRGMLFDYVQVGAEPPESFQPHPQNMPFPMPPGFTLDEIAEIIQFIYAPNLPNPKLDMSRAILGIQRRGENIEVEMGVREGPLLGRRGTWKCKKTNGVWAVVDTSEWVN